MKTNREIRREAWTLLWKEGWFWRMLAGCTVLFALTGAALFALVLAFRSLDIGTLAESARANVAAAAKGLPEAAEETPTLRLLMASLFQSFVQYLFMGIGTFGVTALGLRAVRGVKAGWLGAALSGFATPFSQFWLMFDVQIRTMFWCFVWVLPAVLVTSVLGASGVLGLSVTTLVAALVMLAVGTWLVYRYFIVWFLRVDHPEWTSGQCISVSVAAMRGRKGRAVRLDCSYWVCLLWAIPLTGAFGWLALEWELGAGELSLRALAVALALMVVSAVYAAIVGLYVMLGHAVFYRELQAELSAALAADDDRNAVGNDR